MPIAPREFLQQLNAEERAALRAVGTVQRREDGDVLLEAGEVDDCVLVVLAGAVKVSRHGTDIGRGGPGSLVGEMSVVDHVPRSATVTAEGDVEVLTVPANQFRSYLGRTPRAALAVIEQLGRRLRDAER